MTRLWCRHLFNYIFSFLSSLKPIIEEVDNHLLVIRFNPSRVPLFWWLFSLFSSLQVFNNGAKHRPGLRQCRREELPMNNGKHKEWKVLIGVVLCPPSSPLLLMLRRPSLGVGKIVKTAPKRGEVVHQCSDRKTPLLWSNCIHFIRKRSILQLLLWLKI